MAGRGWCPRCPGRGTRVRPGRRARWTMVAAMSAACIWMPGPCGGAGVLAGVGLTRVDHHHPDVGAAHVVQQRLGEAVQAELAGRVGGGAGVGLLAVHRADDEDVAPFLAQHARQKAARGCRTPPSGWWRSPVATPPGTWSVPAPRPRRRRCSPGCRALPRSPAPCSRVSRWPPDRLGRTPPAGIRRRCSPAPAPGAPATGR